MIEKDLSEAPDPLKYEASHRRIGRALNFLWDIHIIGMEHIPENGPAILAFTHRTRLVDPFTQGIIMPRAMSAMMKDKYQNIPIISKYLAARGIFFVNPDDPREGYETAYSAIEKGMLLDMNPEGTSTHRGSKITIKEGTAALAVRAEKNGIECPIVPIGMDTELLWRRYLRLSRHMPIVIGPPFRAEVAGKSVKTARKETNAQLERRLQLVSDLARAIR